MAKVKNKSRILLAINMPSGDGLHLAPKEVSSDLSEEDLECKEIKKLIDKGYLAIITG